MNLEDLNLVELNAQEVVAVDGGFWWLDWMINVGGPSIDIPGGGVYTGSTQWT